MWKPDDPVIQWIQEMELDFMVIDTEGRVVLAKRAWDGKIILDDITWGGWEAIEDVFYAPEFPDVLVQVVKPHWEGKPCLHDEIGRVYDIKGFMSDRPTRLKVRAKKGKKKKKKIKKKK